MEREWLAEQLGAGRSIESLAREVGRSPSTVAYWADKHGLRSSHAERHAARGGIDRGALERLVADGRTVQEMAEALGYGGTSVRHWLRKYGLRTARARVVADPEAAVQVRICRHHGETAFVRTGRHRHWRCKRCRTDHVSRRRRRLKAVLVAEAGGACAVCGYDRFAGALQFHHVDRTTKTFGLATQGVARSLEKARVEARKCVLLCANCHAEVEAGVATIPPDRPPRVGRHTGRG